MSFSFAIILLSFAMGEFFKQTPRGAPKALILFGQSSGPGGSRRGRSPVESRGNLYVSPSIHPSVRLSVRPRLRPYLHTPEAPQRLSKTSQGLAQRRTKASQLPAQAFEFERPSPTSERADPASDRSGLACERSGLVSESERRFPVEYRGNPCVCPSICPSVCPSIRPSRVNRLTSLWACKQQNKEGGKHEWMTHLCSG